MSSSSGAGGGPIRRRRSVRLVAKNTDPEQHSPLHEMHLAIERANDFADVQKLLDKGHTFCKGNGLNCFFLAASNYWARDSSWLLLMKMLEVDSSGILVKDEDGKTLLNYYSRDVDKIKKLIELGVDLNNVDNSGKTAIQSLFSSDVFSYNYEKVWKMLMKHKEIENYVTKGDFFEDLKPINNFSSLGPKMFCILVQKGVMSVEELTAKLKMHPLFFIMQLDCYESDKLLHYIWMDNPDKNENVAAIGADLNILDDNGKTLMECLLDPAVLKKYNSNRTYHTVEIWNFLIKHSEIQKQAFKNGFLRSLAPLAGLSVVVSEIFESIFRSSIWSLEKLTSELQMHPIVFLLKLAEGNPSEFLEVVKEHPYFLMDKPIIINQDYVDDDEDDCQSWLKIKDVLNIANTLTFDIFGYILFNFRFIYVGSCFEVEENRALFKCLSTLLKYGCKPSSAAGVVHPVHALLYNFNCRGYYDRSSEQKLILHTFLETITFFNDFPFPHQLVLYPKTGSLVLDVHLLISLMLYSAEVRDTKANETLLFELIMAMMQLSPLHPLQNFASIYNHSLRNFKHLNYKKAILQTFRKLLRLCLEASGKHKFQEVDQQTINCVNCFFQPVEEQFDEEFETESEDDDEYEYEYGSDEISLHEKAEKEVSSLQWLSILQIRKTLFLNRSSTTVTLPSLIRGLVADKRLPKGLEAAVLVYKANSCVNLIFKFQ